MVETNVHFPTDINLLLDAIRKVIQLIAKLCKNLNISGWRQSKYLFKTMKRQMLKLQKLKHSTSKSVARTLQKEKSIKKAHKKDINDAESILEKVSESLKELLEVGLDPSSLESIKYFVSKSEKQIDLISRRVIQGEKIPHNEKDFSIFEPHTEWICKGKAGVPVELGVKLAILEDHLGFILNYQTMQNQTDDQVAVTIVQESKKMFPNLSSCSFDKGFHSPSNQIKLKEILDTVALPKKGKLLKKDVEHQQSKTYKVAKRKHSAVESAINAL